MNDDDKLKHTCIKSQHCWKVTLRYVNLLWGKIIGVDLCVNKWHSNLICCCKVLPLNMYSMNSKVSNKSARAGYVVLFE